MNSVMKLSGSPATRLIVAVAALAVLALAFAAGNVAAQEGAALKFPWAGAAMNEPASMTRLESLCERASIRKPAEDLVPSKAYRLVSYDVTATEQGIMVSSVVEPLPGAKVGQQEHIAMLTAATRDVQALMMAEKTRGFDGFAAPISVQVKSIRGVMLAERTPTGPTSAKLWTIENGHRN